MIRLKEYTKNRKIYGNYKVFSPDGVLMFRCDLKKINWYLSRNLAVRINDNDIKLTFTPNGLGSGGVGYGSEALENKCVICGSTESLTKHHVVPRCYRIHFPEEIKSHSHHDVLSVCVECHFSYETEALKYKKELSNKYEAPMILPTDLKKMKISRLKGLFSCLNQEKIPESRKKQIKKEIRSELGIKKITNKMISDWINNEKKIQSRNQRTHGEIVVSQLDDINEFIINWRNHFVQNTNPKHLPKKWSINHGFETKKV